MIAFFIIVLIVLCIALFIRIQNMSEILEEMRRRLDNLSEEVWKNRKKEVDANVDVSVESVEGLSRKKTESVEETTAPVVEKAEETMVQPSPKVVEQKPQVSQAVGRVTLPKRGPTGKRVIQRKDEPIPDAVPRNAFDLIVFLRGIGLWPPVVEGESKEKVLVTWISTRVGALIGILSIIFFASYVSSGSPVKRFFEMLAASVGVFGLGMYFLKRRPPLGTVLTATGLSMIYITSVAGYAVGPVKVTENIAVAAFMQLGALFLNFGMGTRLKSQGMLIMSLIFGYVSCLFAALEGFREAALISSLLIYLAGLISYRRIGGYSLVSLSLGGVYLPLGGFILIPLIKDAAVYPAFWSVVVFLSVTVSCLPLIYYIKGEQILNTYWNRIYQSVNTTLALGFGYLFVKRFYPMELTEFYGVMALLFVAWAIIWYFKDKKGLLFNLFIVKGSSLASLWFINHYHGDLRWMALGLQVIVLAFSVRRSGSIFVEAIALLTWCASFIYYADTNFNEAFGSFLWFMELVYVLVSVAGLGYLLGYEVERRVWRKIVYGMIGFVLAVVAVAFSVSTNMGVALDESANVALMTLAVGAVSLIPGIRKYVALITAAFMFPVFHIIFWVEPSGIGTLGVLLAVTAVALAGFLYSKKSDGKLMNLSEIAVHLLWVLSVLVYLNRYNTSDLFPLVLAVFGVVLWCGAWTPAKRLSELCLLPFVWLFLNYYHEAYSGFALWGSLVILAVIANASIYSERFKEHFYLLKKYDLSAWIMNVLFFILAKETFVETLSWTSEMICWLVLGATYFVFWYFRKNWVSFTGAIVAGALPVFEIVVFQQTVRPGMGIEHVPWAWQVISIGLLACGAWLTVGSVAKIKVHEKFNSEMLKAFAWISAIFAYGVYLFAFNYPLLQWDTAYTPLLAVFSIVLIILGIVIKSKPFRYAAMLSFIVPVYRLFVYDIKETLYRIVAFAILAVLLTFVGFLYSKFASRID